MSSIKIYPFGGVAEIGSNMTVFETSNHIVVADYGILFPNDDFFNLNYLIADTSQLPKDKPITLFITHGHEDHIGAVPHFVKNFPEAKIYAPRLAKELLLGKFERDDLSREITEYEEDLVLDFDEFQLHPIHVTHSIPDTFGFVFRSSELAVLFISDFKFDLNPSFEKPFHLAKIQKLFKESKTTLAMLDSTNIMSEGKTPSETDLIEDLEKLLAKKNRTFVTLFSSNLYRIRNILEIAKKQKKRVCTIGRSIRKYLEAADKTKILSLEDYPLIDIESIQNHEDPNIIYIVTGSQGEYLGAAKRIITGNQKNINLKPDDQFIFSSKPIPGNESKIYQLYNMLAEKGIIATTFKDANIHASGHPCQEDLKSLISGTMPDHYIPIHGETYFLRHHVKFLKKHFPKIDPIFLMNFTGIEFKNSKFKTFSFEEIQPHIIHGNGIVLERERISERRKIADNGALFISLNHKTQNISITPSCLPLFAEDYYPKVRDIVDYSAFVKNKKRDYDFTVEEVRIAVRRFFQPVLGYKPIVIVHMV